jgi:hypothetical protein
MNKCEDSGRCRQWRLRRRMYSGENLAGRAMQRHQPRLAEFGAADGQYCCLEIDILKLKVAGFPEAQPGDTQEAEQTVVAPRAQLPAFIAEWHLERGAQGP